MSLHQYRNDLPYRDDYLLAGEQVYLDEVHKVYVERRGEGLPLLLVPGFSGDAGELAPLADLLAADFSTVGVDRRGYSRSPRGWNKSSHDRQADDLGRLLAVLDLAPAFVLAVGLGAAVALKLLARYPGRVRGALLHEPFIPALLPDPPAFLEALAQGEAAVQAARPRRNTGPLEARMRFLMGAGFEALPPEVRARVVKNGEMHAVECVYALDWLPPPARLFPAERSGWMVSAGRGSPPGLLEMSERLAADLGLPLLQVHGMHAPWLEDPAAFHAAIRPLLDGWLAAARAGATTRSGHG